MPDDHPYWDVYRQRRIVMCVGQGAWEDELLDSTRQMDAEGEECACLDRLLGPRFCPRLGLVAQADSLFHGPSACGGNSGIHYLISILSCISMGAS